MVKISFEEIDTLNTKKADGSAFRITETAAKQLGKVLQTQEKAGKTDPFLRIIVKGGGCNGYTYSFKLDTEKNENDFIATHEEYPHTEVRLDPESCDLLYGSTLDYVETIELSQFVINNPNATSSCGCGNSFGY